MPPQEKNEFIYSEIRKSSVESGFRKYPTNRDISFAEKSITKWLEGKVIDDDLPGPYWRIHNKLYDLSEFSDKHPGGKKHFLSVFF